MGQYEYATHQLSRTLAPKQLRQFASLAREAARSIPSMILYRQHELEWTDQEWADVLADEKLHWIVCTAVTSDATPNTLDEGRWVGVFALHGPLPEDIQTRLQLQQHATDDTGGPIPCWAASRLYIKARHRASSRATEQMFAASRRAVIDAMRKASSDLPQAAAIFSTVAGHVEDSVLHQYYTDAGADVVGHMSYRDCLELYGEIERVPSDVLANCTGEPASKLLLRFRWDFRMEEQSSI